ncbi:MAG: exodeoxyribonuclease VII small subunit [Bacteroidota bacterium]
MSKKKELDYEAALNELQTIVNELQEDMVSVDDLANKAKRAAELVKFCQEKLRNTEEEINGLFSQ